MSTILKLLEIVFKIIMFSIYHLFRLMFNILGRVLIIILVIIVILIILYVSVPIILSNYSII